MLSMTSVLKEIRSTLHPIGIVVIVLILLPFVSQAACSSSAYNPIQWCTFGEVANAVSDFILGVALPVAIIMILYAGVVYMTSGGSPEKVKTAHRALVWGLIGVAVVLVGKGLVIVICNALGGTSCTG